MEPCSGTQHPARPIRVARIITRLNVGGPAYQAAILNHLLPRYGYETLLIHGTVAPGEVFFESLLHRYPGPTFRIPSLSRTIRPRADARALIDLVRVLRQFKPHVVHTHMAKAGMLGRLAAKIAGGNVVVHTYHGHVLEGYFNSPAARSILYLEKILARLTDQLVCISPKLTAELAGKFRLAPRDKFSTIELGLPLDQYVQLPPRGAFRQRFSLSPEALVLGSLGRLAPIKNYHRMLRVFHQLRKRCPGHDLHLLIGGTGPQEHDLRQIAWALAIDDRVHFAGLVEDLPQFYADIDITILTSDNEGTPVTLLEAQAAGKYCVAPDVGGIGDILDPQVGKVVRPNEVEAYVEALTGVIHNWDRAERVSPAFREKIIDRFSPERLVRDIDALYRKLLRSKKTLVE